MTFVALGTSVGGFPPGIGPSFAIAALCAVLLVTTPLWLLSGTPDAVGLVLIGSFAALAGVGLGLAVRAHVAIRARGASTAGALNAGFVVLFSLILWLWGNYLAEPPCPTC